MSDLSYYTDNEHWMSMMKYAMGPPNGGHYKRWVQGSPGMMEPMPLYSNEYAHTYMKHGQNNIVPYRGNVKPFSPLVTPEVHHGVNRCTQDTTDNVGCSTSAAQQIISSGYGGTPHPFGISYQTGRLPSMEYQIPPNDHRQ